MTGRLVHRGPDDDGFYDDPSGRFHLGARRLSIIDVAGGHQPVANERETIWAAQNGEIYNHRALRDQLRGLGHEFRSDVDTEVLVHLYEEFGSACVHALEGMYAFAIWDETTGSLLLARDRSGEKPLFHTTDGPALSFASELGPLVSEGLVDGTIDEGVIDAYFVLGYVPPDRSVVRGVTQLPPGCLLTWSETDGAHVSRYWDPDGAARAWPTPSETEAIAVVDELLQQAVRSRLVADVPTGMFLSGGLDSTLITAMACEQREIDTFSVGYDVGNVSETSAAAATAARLHTTHHELVLRSDRVAEVSIDVLGRLDQPLADRAVVPMAALAAFARERVTVAVGGEGADEYFAGYPRYAWLRRGERADEVLPAFGRRWWALLAAHAPAKGRQLTAVLAEGTASERNLGWVSGGRGAVRDGLYGERLRSIPFEADLASRVFTEAGGTGDAGLVAMVCDQRVWLPGDVLTKADRAGMLASLEIRTPFLSRELMEFANSLPLDAHLRSGPKSLLRGVFARHCPGVTLPRKRAFEVPAREWLKGPLSPYLTYCINDGRVVRDKLLRADRLRVIAREHTDGVSDWSHVLWPVIALNAWLEGAVGIDAD